MPGTQVAPEAGRAEARNHFKLRAARQAMPGRVHVQGISMSQLQKFLVTIAATIVLALVAAASMGV